MAGRFRRTSTVHEENEDEPQVSENGHKKSVNPYEPLTSSSTPPPHGHSLAHRLGFKRDEDSPNGRTRSVSRKRQTHYGDSTLDTSAIQRHNEAEQKRVNAEPTAPKAGLGPRPVGGDEKLGMFSGVYVPTCLNVLSIIMFLRFGMITGMYIASPEYWTAID